MASNSYRNAAKNTGTVLRADNGPIVPAKAAGTSDPDIIAKAKALVGRWDAFCMHPTAENALAYSDAAKALKEAL